MALTNAECVARYRARHLAQCRERDRLAARAKRKRLPEYNTWQNMLTRCYNPKNPQWKDYGGRGIKVCPRWRNSFAAFRADMGAKPSHWHTIERKENAGNYTPKNCVWATRKIQAENTRRNLIVRGKPLSVVVGNTGTAYDRVRMRLRRGWTEDRALGGVL
jgi:hypothetical protein